MDTYRNSDRFIETKKSPLRNIWGNIKKNKESFIVLFSLIMVVSLGWALLTFQPKILAYWIAYFVTFGITYIIYTIIAQIVMMMTEDPDCNDYYLSSKRHKALCNKYKVWYALND